MLFYLGFWLILVIAGMWKTIASEENFTGEGEEELP